MVGLTVIRNEQMGEETERVTFERGEYFTSEIPLFLKKLKSVQLYGGGGRRQRVHPHRHQKGA